MKLIAYTLGFEPTEIRPGPAKRDFMESTSNRYAYRCLPLNIANQYGWELICPGSFEVTWDGGDSADAMVVETLEQGWPPPVSHFGHGVLTFHVNVLFRTEPGTQLMVMGPVNNPKDGATGLVGIIETDWSHYSFTMNWKLTRPFHPVRFMKGEPFAHIFPISLSAIEQVRPTFMPIDADPELKRAFHEWQDSRNAFNEALKDPQSDAAAQKWQKAYFRGLGPDACPVKHAEHRTKVDVKPFPRSTKSLSGGKSGNQR